MRNFLSKSKNIQFMLFSDPVHFYSCFIILPVCFCYIPHFVRIKARHKQISASCDVRLSNSSRRPSLLMVLLCNSLKGMVKHKLFSAIFFSHVSVFPVSPTLNKVKLSSRFKFYFIEGPSISLDRIKKGDTFSSLLVPLY
jgi:hypothetical protein